MKKNVIITALSAALIFLSGCSAEKAVEEPVYTFIDALGREYRSQAMKKQQSFREALRKYGSLQGASFTALQAMHLIAPTSNFPKM